MEKCLNSKSSAAPKLERKVVEKNRRNYMKTLYNELHSLLPSTHASTSKEITMSVSNQVDVVVSYIESLKLNLEKNKKHLEELKMGPKKAQSLNANTELGPSTTSLPRIEFHEMVPKHGLGFNNWP